MDSSYQFPYTRVFRGSSQSQRLERINANPYDSFNDSQTSICSTASQKLVSYFKDKMSGVVSGLKGFFGAEEKPLLSSIVLNSSVTLPYIPSEKLNSISSSIQNTVQKPEYQDKYNNSLNASMLSSGKSSVQNVMKYYKDVSVDKVREKIQKQDSKALDLSVSCAVRPKPVYSSVNTSLNSSRLDIGYESDLFTHHSSYYRKDNLNVHGKRELRSILHDQNKTNKGNKKVSFVPELRRVDFPSPHHHLTYPKSSSSIIKYTSSDDEDTLCVDDRTQKKLFTTNTKIFIKPQTLNVSVIPTKKLKVNPFHKKVLEKNVLPKSAKIAKKQFPEDFARKFNHENSFGSDNLVNDSKLETDSDESNLHQATFDHQNFINSLAKKKNHKRGGDYDSSSETSEKESPKLESPKNLALAPIPLEDDEVDVDRFEDNNNEIQEEEAAPVEEPPKKVQETTKPSSLFGNLTSAAPVVENKSTENSTPALKLTGGLFSNNTETKPVETKPASSGLFGGLTSAPVVTETKPVETKPASSGLFGGLTTPAATETKPAETKPVASSGLFGAGLFGGNNNKPAAVPETSEKNVPEEPKKIEESAPKVEAPVHSMFANMNRQPSVVQHSNNPFLSASSQPKTVDFASLISGGATAATTESQPAAVAEPMETQNVETTMENNTNNNTNEPPAITGGFLGLISAKNNGQSSSMFSNTLKPTSNYSWMNAESNEEQKSTNLFGGMSGGGMFGNNNNNNNNQSSMFTQNTAVNPFASSTDNQGGMSFEGGMGDNNNNNAGGMFGGFGNNNNNNNNNFGGLSRQGSSMNNGLFGGNSSGGFQNNSMFGGNSGGIENNNPFLQSQNSFTSSFGGGASDNNLMRSNSTFGAGSAKKGKQKERAF